MTLKRSLLIASGVIASVAFTQTTASADTTTTVSAGQTLSQIASQYQTSVDAIARANQISNPNLIFVGQHLTIPTDNNNNAGPSVQQQNQKPVSSTSQGSYTVKSGDTLWQIALSNNMSLADLLSKNNLQMSDIIYPGMSLVTTGTSTTNAPAHVDAPTPSTPTPSQSASNEGSYTVVGGDTLNAISAKTGVPLATLVSLNGIQNANLIYVGQVLKLSGAPAQQTTNTTNTPQPSVSAPSAETHNTDVGQSSDWLSLAKSLIGTPYVWGGKTPAGFDCSGFIAYVFNNSGRTSNFPAYTVAEEAAVNQIPVDQAQPGDVLFWGEHGATYHAGIYLGNNQFIDSPQPGESVGIHQLYPGWMPSFAGQVR